MVPSKYISAPQNFHPQRNIFIILENLFSSTKINEPIKTFQVVRKVYQLRRKIYELPKKLLNTKRFFSAASKFSVRKKICMVTQRPSSQQIIFFNTKKIFNLPKSSALNKLPQDRKKFFTTPRKSFSPQIVVNAPIKFSCEAKTSSHSQFLKLSNNF